MTCILNRMQTTVNDGIEYCRNLEYVGKRKSKIDKPQPVVYREWGTRKNINAKGKNRCGGKGHRFFIFCVYTPYCLWTL